MEELCKQIKLYNADSHVINDEDKSHMLLYFTLINRDDNLKTLKKNKHHSIKSIISNLTELYAKNPGQHQIVYSHFLQFMKPRVSEDFETYKRESAEYIAHSLIQPDQSDPISVVQAELIGDYIRHSTPEHARELLLKMLRLLGSEATLEREIDNVWLRGLLPFFTVFWVSPSKGSEHWDSDFLQVAGDLISRFATLENASYRKNIHTLFLNIAIQIVRNRKGYDSATVIDSMLDAETMSDVETMAESIYDAAEQSLNDKPSADLSAPSPNNESSPDLLQPPVHDKHTLVRLDLPRGYWEQKFFLMITQSAMVMHPLSHAVSVAEPPRQPLYTVMLYGSRALALIMEVLYRQRPSSFTPKDWDFYLHSDHYLPLVQQLPIDEEARMLMLNHFNTRGNLFSTWSWLDNQQFQYLTVEVLAYEIREVLHLPKGVRLSIFTLNNNGQYQQSIQFDLTFVFDYSELNYSFPVPISVPTENGAELFCPVIATGHFLKNWGDMLYRYDFPVLRKALPRIEHWLTQERALNRKKNGGEISELERRLKTLADGMKRLLKMTSSGQSASQAAPPDPDIQPLADTQTTRTVSKKKKKRAKKAAKTSTDLSRQVQSQPGQTPGPHKTMPEDKYPSISRPLDKKNGGTPAIDRSSVRNYDEESLQNYIHALRDVLLPELSDILITGAPTSVLHELREITDFMNVHQVGKITSWKRKRFSPDVMDFDRSLLSNMIKVVNEIFRAIQPGQADTRPIILSLSENDDVPDRYKNVPLASLANFASLYINEDQFSLTNLQALVIAVLRYTQSEHYSEEVWSHLRTLFNLAFQTSKSSLPPSDIYDGLLFFLKLANEYKDLGPALKASDTLSQIVLRSNVRLTELQQGKLKAELEETWSLVRAEKSTLTNVSTPEDSSVNLTSVGGLINNLKNNVHQDLFNTQGITNSWTEELNHWRNKRENALSRFKKQHALCLEAKEKKAEKAYESLLDQESRLANLRDKRNRLVLKTRVQRIDKKNNQIVKTTSDSEVPSQQNTNTEVTSTGFQAVYQKAVDTFKSDIETASVLFKEALECKDATSTDKAAAWSGIADGKFKEIKNESKKIKNRHKKTENMLRHLEDALKNFTLPSLSRERINDLALEILDSFKPLTNSLEEIARYQANAIQLLQGSMDDDNQIFLDIIKTEARSVAELLTLLISSRDQLITVYRRREEAILKMCDLNRKKAESREATLRKRLETMHSPYELPPAMDFSYGTNRNAKKNKHKAPEGNTGPVNSAVANSRSNPSETKEDNPSGTRKKRSPTSKETSSNVRLSDLSDAEVFPYSNDMDQQVAHLWQLIEKMNNLAESVDFSPGFSPDFPPNKPDENEDQQTAVNDKNGAADPIPNHCCRRQAIQLQEYENIPIDGDGNCLYSALVKGLAALNINMTVDELRKTLGSILNIIVSIIRDQPSEQQPPLWEQLRSITGWSQNEVEAILIGNVIATNASQAQGNSLAFHQQYGETGVVALLPFISNQPIAIQTNNGQINYYDLELWHDVAPELLSVITGTLPVAETPTVSATSKDRIPFILTHSQGANELSDHFGIMVHQPQPQPDSPTKTMAVILMFAHFLSTHISGVRGE